MAKAQNQMLGSFVQHDHIRCRLLPSVSARGERGGGEGRGRAIGKGGREGRGEEGEGRGGEKGKRRVKGRRGEGGGCKHIYKMMQNEISHGIKAKWTAAH